MRVPIATYRLQFRPEFCFASAQKILPYLAELGISDIYASPILKARSGSIHGYDVVDTNQINPELGTEAEFEALMVQLQEREMGWVQDIVPNHMAYDSQNQFLMDVLVHGQDSEYCEFFDIDWEHPYEDIRGKVLTPMMGYFYGQCLENGEIKLSYDERGLSVNYYGLKIPLRIESYASFLNQDFVRLSRSLGRSHPDAIKILGILYIVKNIPSETAGIERKEQAEFVKGLLWELYNDNQKVKGFIDQNLKRFNGEVGKPESFDLLEDLLGEQFFRLSFWKVGAEELNYRRFFTVNELICLRIEDAQVFEKTHALIDRLVGSGKLTGLRIDHIDGLYAPTEYLERLRAKMGDIYIVAEKILELGEELPSSWKLQGTSGYDFLNHVNSIFCQKENENAFTDLYERLTGLRPVYEEMLADKKRLIAETNLVGDVNNLAHLLKRIAGGYRYGRDFTLEGLRKAILEVLVQFPIYCTYIDREGVSDRARGYLQEAIEKTKSQIPQLLNEINLIEKFPLLEYDEWLSESERERWLHFSMRFQQFSGPLMAKGIEDTLFYVYNRLVSLNEVGGHPDRFGLAVSEFHEYNQKKLADWPHAMNATSTHDTKRSEDTRLRINVLSEMPEEWEQQVKSWREMNRDKKTVVGKRSIPDRNDEYFLYQNMLGAFPEAVLPLRCQVELKNEGLEGIDTEEYTEFVGRIKDYVIKAVREAKVHTAWLRADTEYEEGFVAFVDQILNPGEENEFLSSFRAFQQRLAVYGSFNSLSQTLLKIASPGVPDFYQGTELWDLSLVDPDNRRPVNYDDRLSFLQEIKRRCQTGMMSLISDLKATRADGRMKLFSIARALEARKQYLPVFQEGDYLPLQVSGQYANHIVAFARHYQGKTAIAVAPRLLARVIGPEQYPLGTEVWGDTRLEIPAHLQSNWIEAIVNAEISGNAALSVGEILQYFPVALLVSS